MARLARDVVAMTRLAHVSRTIRAVSITSGERVTSIKIVRPGGNDIVIAGTGRGEPMRGAAAKSGGGPIARKVHIAAKLRRATSAAVHGAIDVVQCSVFAPSCLTQRHCGRLAAIAGRAVVVRADGGGRVVFRAIS